MAAQTMAFKDACTILGSVPMQNTATLVAPLPDSIRWRWAEAIGTGHSFFGAQPALERAAAGGCVDESLPIGQILAQIVCSLHHHSTAYGRQDQDRAYRPRGHQAF